MGGTGESTVLVCSSSVEFPSRPCCSVCSLNICSSFNKRITDTSLFASGVCCCCCFVVITFDPWLSYVWNRLVYNLSVHVALCNPELELGVLLQLDSRQVSSLVTVPLPSFCSRVTSDITKVQASSSKVSRVLKSQCQPTAARFDALDAWPSRNVTAARECCITRLRPGVTSRCHLQDNTETFECTRYTRRRTPA